MSSNQNTPVPTPTAVFAPPSPRLNGSQHRHRDSVSSLTAPSPPTLTASFVHARSGSPARSNSTSSIITQTSTSQTGVLSNPPLISGQVPGIAATNSGKIVGVPITTPPETPQSFPVHTGTKRDTNEGEVDKSAGSQPKRRRIAPTLVSNDSGGNGDDAKA